VYALIQKVSLCVSEPLRFPDMLVQGQGQTIAHAQTSCLSESVLCLCAQWACDDWRLCNGALVPCYLLQGSAALAWLARELLSVPPDMRAQALRIPGELASRVSATHPDPCNCCCMPHCNKIYASRMMALWKYCSMSRTLSSGSLHTGVAPSVIAIRIHSYGCGISWG